MLQLKKKTFINDGDIKMITNFNENKLISPGLCMSSTSPLH